MFGPMVSFFYYLVLILCIFNKILKLLIFYGKIVLFVLGFNGLVNNEVMSSRSVNSGTVPGQA